MGQSHFPKELAMITKNIKQMINYCFSYADNVQYKPGSPYPPDARVTLKNQLKDDLLIFLHR